MRDSRAEIKSLTGLRGLAALMIVLYHYSMFKSSFSSSPFHLKGAYLAVDVFFIMSGFVLSYNYHDVFSVASYRVELLNFLRKRVARLYPAYFIILGLSAAKILVNVSGDRSIDRFSTWDWIGNLLMLTGWGLHVRAIVGPSWSVSAEIFCYFLMPFILRFVFRSWAVSLVAVTALVLLLALVATYGNGANGVLDVTDDRSQLPLVRALCGFTIGVSLFFLNARLARLDSHFYDWLAFFASFTLLLTYVISTNDLVRYPLLILLVAALGQDPSMCKKIFANSAVYYLGEVSYSLYLVHALYMPIFYRVSGTLRHYIAEGAAFWISLLLYVSASVLTAAVTYPLFEVRGRRLFLRLLGGRAKHAVGT